MKNILGASRRREPNIFPITTLGIFYSLKLMKHFDAKWSTIYLVIGLLFNKKTENRKNMEFPGGDWLWIERGTGISRGQNVSTSSKMERKWFNIYCSLLPYFMKYFKSYFDQNWYPKCLCNFITYHILSLNVWFL